MILSAILIKDANEIWHKWFNLERKIIAGNHVNDLFPADPANLVNMEEHDVLSKRQSVEKEIMSPLLSDGAQIPTLLQIFPVPGDDGSIVGLGGINTDMRATKKTGENLRQALIKSEESNHSKIEISGNHEPRTAPPVECFHRL